MENNKENVEKPKRKFLFVDDSESTLDNFRDIFPDSENVFVVRCTSVEDVLKAIEDVKPDVLFLDHHLGGGDDGFEVVKRVGQNSDLEIISTTSRTDLIPDYKTMGVKHIMKGDVDGLREIVFGK